MEYGFFTVAITLTLCALAIICAFRLPNLISAWFEGRAKLIHARKN